MLAAREYAGDCIHGVILAAPAVWGWQTMPFWQATLLKIAAWLFPAREVTGEGLDIKPSDNIEMLRALARDPLVIKSTRIDTIYGLTGLMEQAFRSGGEITLPVLLLYGERDEIIPRHALCRMIARLPDGPDSPWQVVLYPEGYHMLTRDLQADRVLGDIAAWVTAEAHRELPSGQVLGHDSGRLEAFCNGS
jgi:alpha-beta hydrolase superfamily lysophospholipase